MDAPKNKFAQALTVVQQSRRRFLISVAFLLVAWGISFIFANKVILFLEGLAPANTKFVAYALEANFEIYVKVALYSGLALVSPFLFIQTLLTLSPVLNSKIKFYLYTFIPLILIFFIGGIVYATYVFAPMALKFTIGFVSQISPNITPMIDLGNYIGFLTRVYFMIGLAFELPVIIFILAKFGIVSHTWLLKKWRWGVLGSAVIAALVTPTGDVFHDSTKDLILMDCGLSVSGPIFFLYFVSIFMAWLARRPKQEVPISDVALEDD